MSHLPMLQQLCDNTLTIVGIWERASDHEPTSGKFGTLQMSLANVR
jgi:hypothetical protein